jgi:SAM-dependent methyltransferase
VDAGYFEALFAESDDPWSFRSRWYEARKRALTLACLPDRRYASGFEPGCANGELSAALATRCDTLLVCDGTEQALQIARRRLADCPHVSLANGWVPGYWPAASFDLIVLSEFCYYLDRAALTRLAQQAQKSLNAGGTLLACHWRKPIPGCQLAGDAVHRLLHDGLALPHLCSLADSDLLIDVWGSSPLSVAQREQIRS